MAGETLHVFDLALCDYVLGQIRADLRGRPGPPGRPARLSYDEWQRLDLSAWLDRLVAGLPAGLAAHARAGEADDGAELLLSDDELYTLELVTDNPPPRAAAAAAWVPYPGLHRRAVECVPEIRAGLTRQTAEEWAEESAGFAARLCRDGVTLAEGIAAVREWVGAARRLLRVMGATAYLPPPDGTHPTPTRPNPVRAAAGRTTDDEGGPKPPARAVAANSAPPAAGMLTPAAVAGRFAVSQSTVYAACRSGLLAHYRVPARAGARGKYLVREADVVAWLESLRVGPGAATSGALAPASSGSPAAPFAVLDPKRLAKAWKPS